MGLKVAALQFGVAVGQKEENIKRALGLMGEAAAAGAKVVVLPELWSTGFDTAHLDEAGEELSGASVSRLRQAAAGHGLIVAGGSVVEKKQGRYYNTSLLLDSNGRLAAKYRKAHLYPHGWREHEYFSPGDAWQIQPLPGFPEFTLGMSVCYDLRFPEFFRNMALRGANLFSVPVAWPTARADGFELFCRARAAENRAFLIAANYAAAGGSEFSGGSLIVDPYGRVLAQCGAGEGMALAELELELARVSRASDPFADRRQFLDEIDNNLI